MPGTQNNSIENHFTERTNNEQIICDPVHGPIGFNYLCLKIIDTPEFQRLRFIKQLGFAYTVYPGANNNRFEHSLGVAYLAKEFLHELRNNQPELNITDEDICCVQIAGLCHDLGHGPFSHTWEKFMEKSKMYRKDFTPRWRHENVSIRIFDYLVKKYKLDKEFEKYGINNEGIIFIRDLIMGKKTEDDRTYFYQIVNNEESGLDVDKWDYYLRDCYNLGVKCGFEYKRLMQFARVIKDKQRKIICFRDKVISTVHWMFRTRSELHHVAYQHRMVRRIEKIICDALIKADGKVYAPNGENFHFYEWTDAVLRNDENFDLAVERFCMMTDEAVYASLKYSNIEEVKNIIEMVERRFQNSKLYQKVSSWNITEIVDTNAVGIELVKCLHLFTYEEKQKLCEKYKTDFIVIDQKDFIIEIISIDWGKGEKNPVNSVYFYSKDNIDKAFKWEEDDVQWMVPKIFRHMTLYVLCNREEEIAFEILKAACEKCRKQKVINNIPEVHIRKYVHYSN